MGGSATLSDTSTGVGTTDAGTQMLLAGTASLSNPNSPNAVAVGAGPAVASPRSMQGAAALSDTCAGIGEAREARTQRLVERVALLRGTCAGADAAAATKRR